MNYLLAVLVLGYIWLVLSICLLLDYRKQNKFLLLKVEGYKNVVLAYMMYRYKDLAKIEKLERQARLCEFAKGDCHHAMNQQIVTMNPLIAALMKDVGGQAAPREVPEFPKEPVTDAASSGVSDLQESESV